MQTLLTAAHPPNGCKPPKTVATPLDGCKAPPPPEHRKPSKYLQKAANPLDGCKSHGWVQTFQMAANPPRRLQPSGCLQAPWTAAAPPPPPQTLQPLRMVADPPNGHKPPRKLQTPSRGCKPTGWLQISPKACEPLGWLQSPPPGWLQTPRLDATPAPAAMAAAAEEEEGTKSPLCQQSRGPNEPSGPRMSSGCPESIGGS